MFQVQALSNDTTIVKVRGDVDGSIADTFSNALDLACARERGRIIVSFEDCPFCDSTAISVLVRARKAVGSRLVIVIPSENRPLTRIFDIVGLTRPFGVVQTLRDALSVPIEA